MGGETPSAERIDVQSGITETAGFIGESEARFFAVVHQPPVGAKAGVVMAPSLLSDRIRTYRAEVGAARQLAARGVAVIRFDYRGFGHSDEHDATVESMVEDLQTARRHLLTVAGSLPITLMGIKWGALIAATSAQPADRLVLWEPPTTGAGYIKEASRAHRVASMGSPPGAAPPTNGSITEMLGFAVSDRLQDSAAQLTMGEAAQVERVLWLTTAGKPPSAASVIIEAWRAGGAQVEIAALGTDESWWFIQPGALPDDNLVGTTVRWICERFET